MENILEHLGAIAATMCDTPLVSQRKRSGSRASVRTEIPSVGHVQIRGKHSIAVEEHERRRGNEEKS